MAKVKRRSRRGCESQPGLPGPGQPAGFRAAVFPLPDGSQIAYGGIHAFADPGVYPMHFSFTTPEGAAYTFDQYIILRDAFYEADPPLNVPAETWTTLTSRQRTNLRCPGRVRTPDQLWNGQWIYPAASGSTREELFWQPAHLCGFSGSFYHTGLDLGYCGGTDIYAPADGSSGSPA